MRSQFVNLHPRSSRLPATLAVPFQGGLYFGRLVHAEADHYNAPLARRPVPFKHDHFHIILVREGEGTFHIDDQEYACRAGDLFFTSPTQRHSFFNVATSHVHYAEITFEFLSHSRKPLEATFDALFAAWTNQPCRPILKVQAKPVFARQFLAAIESLTSRRSAIRALNDLELSSILWPLLYSTFEQFFRLDETAIEDPLNALHDFIIEHFRDPLTLPELARRANLTPNYFSRRFKQLYGRTPIDFQIDLRMQSACTLLHTADRTLEDIALSVGFEDVYYFSRLFKRRVGISPGRYRSSTSMVSRDSKRSATTRSSSSRS